MVRMGEQHQGDARAFQELDDRTLADTVERLRAVTRKVGLDPGHRHATRGVSRAMKR